MLPVALVFDTETDSLLISVPAADGLGDVVLATLPVSSLTEPDRARLGHIRDVEQPLPVDADAELVAAITAASTLAQLKAALTGNVGREAAVAGRPT